MDGCLLQVTGLSKYFGAIQALNGVDIGVAKGSIHGIIGPNGSGKTTLFNCVTGLLKPTTGRVLLDGADITHQSPSRIAHMGIRRTFQAGKLVPGMTVIENVMAGVNDRIGAATVDAAFRLPFVPSGRESEIRESAGRILGLVGMQGSVDRWASDHQLLARTNCWSASVGLDRSVSAATLKSGSDALARCGSPSPHSPFSKQRYLPRA